MQVWEWYNIFRNVISLYVVIFSEKAMKAMFFQDKQIYHEI